MGLTVVIVLVVLAVLVAAAFLTVRARQRKQEEHRLEAAEHRHEAEIRTASADRREAESAERAARAEHEQAQAREQAARARQDRELAEARNAAADRVDPDSRHRDDGRDATGRRGHDGDPAARTDDLRVGETRQPEQRGQDGRTAQAGAAAHAPHEGLGAGHHPERPQGVTDPAARTDDMRLDDGRHVGTQGRHPATEGGPQAGAGPVQQQAGPATAPGGAPGEGHPGTPASQTPASQHSAAQAQTPDTQPGSGWHGPTATGGADTGSDSRDAGPGGVDEPTGPGRHGGAGNAEAERTDPHRPAERPASEPVMPTQRTGEHDRGGQPAEDREHSGPVRALADRLLRRNG